MTVDRWEEGMKDEAEGSNDHAQQNKKQGIGDPLLIHVVLSCFPFESDIHGYMTVAGMRMVVRRCRRALDITSVLGMG